MSKTFKLRAEQLEPLATGRGACFATDLITVEGYPVRFMYREAPDDRNDSGWRFMAGFESDEYLSDPGNLNIYDVNTIANYDRSVIPFLDAPEGSAFEKVDVEGPFVQIADWSPPA